MRPLGAFQGGAIAAVSVAFSGSDGLETPARPSGGKRRDDEVPRSGQGLCEIRCRRRRGRVVRREKFIEFGGPDGGDGGRGGDVVVECVDGLNTLIDYRYQQHFKAKTGMHGMGRDRAGARGADVVLKVPAARRSSRKTARR